MEKQMQTWNTHSLHCTERKDGRKKKGKHACISPCFKGAVERKLSLNFVYAHLDVLCVLRSFSITFYCALYT